MTDDLGALYGRTREQISELARTLSAHELDTVLPTCPDWTVRDVLGHLTGLAHDVVAGRTGNAGAPDWTTNQVAAFAEHDLDGLLTAWASTGATLESEWAARTGPQGVRILSDIYCHEHDIRGALGRPGNRDTAAFEPVAAFQMGNLGDRLTAAGLPGLRLEGADGVAFEAGTPSATVRADSAWELYRAVVARRSRNQVLAYDWSVDPAPYLDVFFRFDPPAVAVVE